MAATQAQHIDAANVISWEGRPRRERKGVTTYWEEYVATDEWYMRELVADVPGEEYEAAVHDEDWADDEATDDDESSEPESSETDSDYSEESEGEDGSGEVSDEQDESDEHSETAELPESSPRKRPKHDASTKSDAPPKAAGEGQ